MIVIDPKSLNRTTKEKEIFTDKNFLVLVWTVFFFAIIIIWIYFLLITYFEYKEERGWKEVVYEKDYF